MFTIKNLSKQYNNEFALNDVSLTISKGLNFIIGASGSGKTTLLKIISGMEQDFSGEVAYCSKPINTLTESEKSYFYNNIFGFVWQDFNLIEESTVLQNVLLPQYLKDNQSEKGARKILRDLGLHELTDQKARYLSGGQKQRVAIARELMKNPQVIIADEPTSALDDKSSKAIIDLLRTIAKSRTVIIVTHDTSFITKHDSVFELDKGELISAPETIQTNKTALSLASPSKLSIKNAFTLAMQNTRNRFSRLAVTALSLVIAATLLLIPISGAISSSGDAEFEKLINTYGQTILDLSLVSSFMSASGTGGNDGDEPSADVSQDIGGLYDKYAKDERVEFAIFIQALNDITVTLGGKDFKIATSNNMPVMNNILSGRVPSNAGNEVVVPESFVKSTGKTNQNILGTEIEINCTLTNWDSGSPVFNPAKIKATVVGVSDTTVSYVYDGEKSSYTLDDAFLLSKPSLDNLRKQANIKGELVNATIRAKTPADLIAIKNELNAQGIVPLGQFELVEDLVKLNDQTSEQSGSASIIIAILAIIMVIAISLITGFIRKREYAIYKVSGYSKSHLSKLTFAESVTSTASAILLALVASPLLNMATSGMFSVNILTTPMLLLLSGLVLLTAIIAHLATSIAYLTTNTAIALKAGDR